jgi:hypothetical protein
MGIIVNRQIQGQHRQQLARRKPCVQSDRKGLGLEGEPDLHGNLLHLGRPNMARPRLGDQPALSSGTAMVGKISEQALSLKSLHNPAVFAECAKVFSRRVRYRSRHTPLRVQAVMPGGVVTAPGRVKPFVLVQSGHRCQVAMTVQGVAKSHERNAFVPERGTIGLKWERRWRNLQDRLC